MYFETLDDLIDELCTAYSGDGEAIVWGSKETQAVVLWNQSATFNVWAKDFAGRYVLVDAFTCFNEEGEGVDEETARNVARDHMAAQ